MHIDMIRPQFLAIFLIVGILHAAPLSADTYLLPPNSDSVVGALGLASAEHEDTLLDLARAYNQGYLEMKLANPTIDTWLPRKDTEVLIPSLYILPDAPRQGIIINVPEMRLYYYPKPRRGEPRVVITYPLSIGRQDWTTPLGLTKVVRKDKNPYWYPPESIRQEHAADGDPLPKVVPPGDDNPLGQHSLRLALEGYLIHGTNKPYGIGMQVTHGCMRLYPADIERLFSEVQVGTSVRIVNQPFKIGWWNGMLYLEAHPYLEEHAGMFADSFTHSVGLIAHATQNARQKVEVDWDLVQKVISERTGIPTAISLEPADSDPLVVDELVTQSMEPRDS